MHSFGDQSLKVFLINLDRATGRLANMDARLAEVPLEYERVPAVDGRTLVFPIPEFSQWSYKFLHGRRTVPAEVGCYLSHVDCARRLLASQASHALILEDDTSFPGDFRDILAAAMARSSGWDILRLSTVNRGRKYPYAPLSPGRSLAVALTREKGAGAYIINRRAADWIVRRLMPMRLAWDIAFDLEYLHGLRAAFVHPVPVGQQNEAETQIQHQVAGAKLPRWRYLTVLPYRAYLELSRLVLRMGRLLALRLKLSSAG